MNVLVLGAGGYVGAALVRELLKRGHWVRGLTTLLENGMSLEAEGMELRVGDITDLESIRGIADDCETVINAIGYCRLEPSASKAIMLDGTRNLIRIADRSALRRYIWTSNVSIYGSPKFEARLDESTPVKPSYGLGRLTRDVEKLASDNLPSVSVRVASVYGPGRDFIEPLQAGRLRLLNGGKNWQSRMHRDDLVSMLMATIEQKSPSATYLASDDLPTTVYDFFAELAPKVGAKMPPTLEKNAARAYSGVTRGLNWLTGRGEYQVNENVIGLMSNNYYCLNTKMKRELGIALRFPTFRQAYGELADGR